MKKEKIITLKILQKGKKVVTSKHLREAVTLRYSLKKLKKLSTFSGKKHVLEPPFKRYWAVFYKKELWTRCFPDNFFKDI